MTWFDRLFYVLLALMGINVALRWRVGLARLRDAPGQAEWISTNGEAILFGTVAAFLLSLVLIWWLASRRRSRIALTLLAAVYLALALIGMFNFATQTYSWRLTMWASAAQILVYLASLVTLALPTSRRWFSRSPDPKDLTETFA